MSEISPRLGLPYLMPAQAQKHVTHNEALERLDLLAQCVLAGSGSVTPPAVPLAGETHALGAAPTGDWAGHGGELAYWTGVAWLFVTPEEGWRAWDAVSGQELVRQGGLWEAQLPGLQNLDGLGVGTSSDATNRLAVASDAALFTHAGSDHRMVLNKAAAADTGSLLYQSGWSGRAEMGLAGSDDFSLKVSADGSSWLTALSADAASGVLSVLAGLTVGGALAYHRGNVLGTVSESGGTPTGALFESGSGAGGSFIRCAGGLQLCWHELTTSAAATTTWSFPASFSDAPVCFASPHSGLTPSMPRTASVGTSSAGFNAVNTAGSRIADTLRVLAVGTWI